MERFFVGMDQENSKTQGGKGQIRIIQKNKKERMEERKRRDFYVCGGSHVFSIGREHPGSTALMRPSLRRTHSYGNLPYNKIPYQHRGQNWSAWKGVEGRSLFATARPN
jgi:hypothetical protein